MIAKLITGDRFGGAVKYITRYGKLNADEEHKLLFVRGVTFDYDSKGNQIINANQVGRDFSQQARAYNRIKKKGGKPIKKPVYHWILSWTKGDRRVSPEEMVRIAKEFLDRMGFGDTQVVVSAHYDKKNQHLHIVANIVNNSGDRISTRGMIDKSHRVARDITLREGYLMGKPANKNTIDNAHAPHDKVRYRIKPVIMAAVSKAKDISELPGLLHGSVVCKINKASSLNKNGKQRKRDGISFAVKHNNVVHTYSGSSLGLSYGTIIRLINARLEQEAELINKEEEKSPAANVEQALPEPKASILGKDGIVHVTRDNYKAMAAQYGFTVDDSGSKPVVIGSWSQEIPEGGLFLTLDLSKGEWRPRPTKAAAERDLTRRKRNNSPVKGHGGPRL